MNQFENIVCNCETFSSGLNILNISLSIQSPFSSNKMYGNQESGDWKQKASVNLATVVYTKIKLTQILKTTENGPQTQWVYKQMTNCELLRSCFLVFNIWRTGSH